MKKRIQPVGLIIGERAPKFYMDNYYQGWSKALVIASSFSRRQISSGACYVSEKLKISKYK